MGHARIVSIDPGSRKTGFAVLEIDHQTGELFVVDAWTLDVDRVAERNHQYMIEVHGIEATRQWVLQDSLWRILEAWKPFVVCCESPYMGDFVATFKRLTEALAAYRTASLRYDIAMPFIMIEPSTAKKSLGVPGNSPDKELVREAVREHPTLCKFIDLDLLDEHSVDAILIGYCHYKSCHA